MAESTVCLQNSEADSLLPFDQEATTSIPSCNCGPGYRPRIVRSKGAVLVIVWSLLTWACHFASLKVDSSVISKFMGVFNFGIVTGVVEAVLYVFAGWLADVYVGRYKVMKASIWVMWLGSVGGMHSVANDLLLIST